MFTRYVVSLGIIVGSIVGIGEATANCPAGTVPVLERISTTVTNQNGVITIERGPVWDGCVPAQ